MILVDNFSFLVLGTGDAFSAYNYSSSILVESGGQSLLLDCPHPIRKILREASSAESHIIDISDISAILLTHLHADHVSGLEGFAFYSPFALQRKTQLIAHPDILNGIWENSLQVGMSQLLDAEDLKKRGKSLNMSEIRERGFLKSYHFDDFFEVTSLSWTEAVKFGVFSIECRETIHHVPTTAFRIRVADKMLAYSADTTYDPSLIEWLSKADVIIHETNYGTHTAYEKLALLPEEIRAKMFLIHYPDDFKHEDSLIRPLIQGKRYSIRR